MVLTLDGSLLRPQRGGNKDGKESERKGKREGRREIHIYMVLYMVSSLRMEEAGAY